MKLIRTNRLMCLVVLILATAILCTAAGFIMNNLVTGAMTKKSVNADEALPTESANKLIIATIATQAVMAIVTIILTICIEFNANYEKKGLKAAVITINIVLGVVGTAVCAALCVITVTGNLAGWKIQSPVMILVCAGICLVLAVMQILGNIFVYAPYTRHFPKQK